MKIAVIRAAMLAVSTILCFALPAAAQVPEEAIRKALAVGMPGTTIDVVRASLVSGLFEVQIGTRVFYVNEAATYMITGSLINVQSGRNMTQERTDAIAADLEKVVMPVLWSPDALQDDV